MMAIEGEHGGKVDTKAPVMNDSICDELTALRERWRMRAREFMADAELARGRPADIVRLTAMASTLEWAARELSLSTPTATPLAPTANQESPTPHT